MITVERESDGLIRRWDFSASGGHNALRLVLNRYTEGTRASKRHKMRGDYWSAIDERRYYSKLPRPVSIPDDVIDEAMKALEIQICIGWNNAESVIASRRITHEQG
jgi:hypothetical protein